jgi:hypothetical protein
VRILIGYVIREKGLLTGVIGWGNEMT